ncbi:MAG: DUF1887 family CARF protein [Gallionella sp.]|jgi:hypothetical protein
MAVNSSNVDSLLAKRNTCRIGKAGNHSDAINRLEISKLLANNYEGFNVLRKHLIHPKDQPKISNPSKNVKSSIELLSDLGWITHVQNGRWEFSKGTASSEYAFIKGNWLEEYVYCAHIHAGVDEVSYGQEVEWKVGDVIGKNEIDVIARRGDKLSFTSCKTQHPFPANGSTNQITGFLTEVDYWDTHFANNNGKLLLVVTADFIDEMENNRHRYPLVVARASVLNVDMIGLEDLRWDRLVEKIGMHWDE